MLELALKLETAAVLGGGVSYDYFIDATTGSDLDDGTTEATAWQSLNKIEGITLADNSSVRVLVKSGTYSKASDSARVSFSGISNCSLEIVFEAGCVIDGTAYVEPTGAALGFDGDAADYTNTFRVRGNGLVIRDVLAIGGNAIGGNNGGTCHYHDIVMTNCLDGMSVHGDQRAKFYDCRAYDCTKFPLAHVGTTVTDHYRCSFEDENGTATAGGLGIVEATATATFEDCVFLPGGTSASKNLTNHNSTYTRCQIGTLTTQVVMLGSNFTASKCFLNTFIEGSKTHTLTNCFGKISTRHVAGTADSTVSRCVFSGPATGYTHCLFSNFNPGSAGTTFVWNNNIFETASFMSVDSTNAAYMVTAGCQFHNNITFGSTYDADLVSAGADIDGTITTDPLIGAANTLLMADYAFGDGSPAIGAATDAGDIGFGAADVEERAT